MRLAKFFIALILLILSGVIVKVELDLASYSYSDQFHKLTDVELRLIGWMVDYIELYRANYGKNPEPEVIEQWIGRQAKGNTYEVFSYEYLGDNYPQELNRMFGDRPEHGFVIRFISPSEYVYYPSWTNRSAEAFIPSADYFLLGSKVASMTFYGLLLAFIWILAIVLLREAVFAGRIERKT